ncbi:putative tetratricopeptide-like helical domain superfamily [Dioscorea sansibarensis]
MASARPPPLPWISPLHYLKGAKPSSPSSPPSPVESRPRRRFISHSDAIRLITHHSDPQQALDLFNSCAAQPGFAHNHATYSAMLLRLARSRKFLAIDALLHRISSEPCRFHESILLSLMPFFSRASLHEKTLVAFFSILPLTRSKPTSKALATCLNLLLSSSRFDLAQSLLSHAQSHLGISPNTCVRNILIKYICKSGDLNAAFKVFEEMRHSDSSSPPNLITYSTLMAALCNVGKLKDAFQLFEEMIERDKIAPDALTYNVLINGFCKHGKVEKAKAVLEFMQRNDCEPNVFNYASLMNGFCKQGRIEDAKKVFDEMQSSCLEPDAVTYTTLISCYCGAGRVDEGIELVKQMRSRDCKADVVTYNVVIEGLCKGERHREAMELLESLPYEGVRLNVASYRIVLNSLCAKGDMEMSLGLLGLMLGRGVVPHFATSNKLLVGLCNAGSIANVTIALFGLTEMGFAPEIGCWIRLVECVCRERKLGRVLERFNEIISHYGVAEF